MFCTTCQPLGETADRRKPSPEGVLQSCEAITKTLTSVSEGNKQWGKKERCVFGKAGPLAEERQGL